MIEILYEDNHLLAVNKPAGLPVQGDISGDTHLLQLAAAYIKEKYKKPGDAFVGLIHRLDRPVSGVVLLARTSKALTRMNEQFRLKKTQKTYHAVTQNPLPETKGTLIHFLGKDAKTHRALTYREPKNGTKEAILHYQLVAERNGAYLYEITLETGRFHQIRAQLAKSGSPIEGDLKYGAKKALSDRSIALHARRLEFAHPVTLEWIGITAPYPQNAVWKNFS